MNNLDEEKRSRLKKAVVLITVIFLIVYSTVMVLKYTNQPPQTKQTNEKPQVIFQQPTLTFFSYKTQLNIYPDRITIHYPYLIVVRPDEFRSEVYDIATKRKEKEVNEVILDYFNGNVVNNKQGYKTKFNNKDLGLLCDRAFIKSKTEIFCITRPDQNKQDNKLISINPETLEQKDIYSSQNILTAVYFNKDTLYVGDYDFDENKAFVTVDGKTSPVGDLVNVIYPMRDKIYTGSFKSLRNKQTESYYEIQRSNEKLTLKLIKKGAIVFK